MDVCVILPAFCGFMVSGELLKQLGAFRASCRNPFSIAFCMFTRPGTHPIFLCSNNWRIQKRLYSLSSVPKNAISSRIFLSHGLFENTTIPSSEYSYVVSLFNMILHPRLPCQGINPAFSDTPKFFFSPNRFRPAPLSYKVGDLDPISR